MEDQKLPKCIGYRTSFVVSELYSQVLHWLCYVLVIFFNLWLVGFDPTHYFHYLRMKFLPQPSVLIPIDFHVVGSEPPMLNLLALSK